MFWCPLLIMPHLSLGTHLIKMCIIQSPNKLKFIFAIWTTKLVIPLVLCSQTLLNKTITIKRTVKNILKQKLALFGLFLLFIFLKYALQKLLQTNGYSMNSCFYVCVYESGSQQKLKSWVVFICLLNVFFRNIFSLTKYFVFFNITSACYVSCSYVFWILL